MTAVANPAKFFKCLGSLAATGLPSLCAREFSEHTYTCNMYAERRKHAKSHRRADMSKLKDYGHETIRDCRHACARACTRVRVFVRAHTPPHPPQRICMYYYYCYTRILYDYYYFHYYSTIISSSRMINC